MVSYASSIGTHQLPNNLFVSVTPSVKTSTITPRVELPVMSEQILPSIVIHSCQSNEMPLVASLPVSSKLLPMPKQGSHADTTGRVTSALDRPRCRRDQASRPVSRRKSNTIRRQSLSTNPFQLPFLSGSGAAPIDLPVPIAQLRRNFSLSVKTVRGRRPALVYCYLAMFFRHKGKHSKAELCQWRCLLHNINDFGADHRETILSMLGLAVSLHRSKKYHLAKKIASKAIIGIQRIYGSTHWRTLVAKHNLALMHAALEEWDHARSLMIDVVNGNRATRDDPHGRNRYLASTSCLAWILSKRGDYLGAFRLCEELFYQTNGKVGVEARVKIFCMELAEDCRGREYSKKADRKVGIWLDQVEAQQSVSSVS